MYIDTGSPVPNIPLKSRGLADENKNKKNLTEWKWFETTVLEFQYGCFESFPFQFGKVQGVYW